MFNFKQIFASQQVTSQLQVTDSTASLLKLKQSQIGGRIFGGALVLIGFTILGYDVLNLHLNSGSLLAGGLFFIAGLGLVLYIGPRYLYLDKTNNVAHYTVARILWPIDTTFSLSEIHSVQQLIRSTSSRKNGRDQRNHRTKSLKKVYYHLVLQNGDRIHLMSTSIPTGLTFRQDSFSVVSDKSETEVPQLIQRIAQFLDVKVETQ